MIIRTRFQTYLNYNLNSLRFRSEEAKTSILDEVLELAVDEEIQVREAALDCLLNMTHLFDDGKNLVSSCSHCFYSEPTSNSILVC